MKIEIDGKKCRAQEGDTVIEVALAHGIDIPHLCWHPALEPYGACRVCMVEVELRGRKRLTTACTYPAAEGLVVFTQSEKAVRARKFSISLLLLLAPDSEKIRALAEQYNVKPIAAALSRAPTNCIRCGLCVRVCRELIGKEAIGFVHRGVERIPETPFQQDNPFCLSCGACAYLCPTGKIIVEDQDVRKIELWHKEGELAACAECGRKFAPLAQLEEIKKKISNDDLRKIFDLCPECRKKKIAQKGMWNAPFSAGAKKAT